MGLVGMGCKVEASRSILVETNMDWGIESSWLMFIGGNTVQELESSWLVSVEVETSLIFTSA